MSTTPYASTSIMPFTNQTQAAAPGAEQPDEGQRVAPLGPPGAQYAQPDRCNGEEGSSKSHHNCFKRVHKDNRAVFVLIFPLHDRGGGTNARSSYGLYDYSVVC